MGYGSLAFLFLAIWSGISAERLWLRILSISYTVLINLPAIYFAVSKGEKGYLFIPLLALLFYSLVQAINKAFD